MGRLNWRKRRELGLTWVNILREAQTLKESGELDREDLGAAAVSIAAALAEEHPSAYNKVSAADWDAIFEFIERLLELFMKFLPLFL